MDGKWEMRIERAAIGGSSSLSLLSTGSLRAVEMQLFLCLLTTLNGLWWREPWPGSGALPSAACLIIATICFAFLFFCGFRSVKLGFGRVAFGLRLGCVWVAFWFQNFLFCWIIWIEQLKLQQFNLVYFWGFVGFGLGCVCVWVWVLISKFPVVLINLKWTVEIAELVRKLANDLDLGTTLRPKAMTLLLLLHLPKRSFKGSLKISLKGSPP